MIFNLVVLRSEQPMALVEFYEALGLNFTVEKHGNAAEHHSCQSGPVTLEIYPASPNTATTATRIGFAVRDLERACREAARLGRVLKETEETSSGRRAVVVDPAGHKVELIQEL